MSFSDCNAILNRFFIAAPDLFGCERYDQKYNEFYVILMSKTNYSNKLYKQAIFKLSI